MSHAGAVLRRARRAVKYSTLAAADTWHFGQQNTAISASWVLYIIIMLCTLCFRWQGMCYTDDQGKENEHCAPCLVGERWDKLRAQLGTGSVAGRRVTVPVVQYSSWLSSTLLGTVYRILLKVICSSKISCAGEWGGQAAMHAGC